MVHTESQSQPACLTLNLFRGGWPQISQISQIQILCNLWMDLFCRDLCFFIECGVEGVPGEGGAFDAHRKLAHASEDLQVAETVFLCLLIQLTHNHRVKFLEKVLNLLFALPFDGLRHHARGCFRDRAARSFKPDFLHRIVFEIDVDSQLIAAEWIVAFRAVISRFELPKVSRLLVMVEDYLLVEFA